MKLPWANQTGLAKTATIFAFVFLVSLGLCGANAALYSHANAIGDTTLLMATGFAESLGMVIGLAGLVIVGIVAVVKAALGKSDGSEDE